MNYQQTKTIQKHKINNSLLLLGLLVFASVMQACGGKKIKNEHGSNVDNQALLTILGKFDGMTAATLKSKVGQDAKEAGEKPVKVQLNTGDVETLKLPKEIKMQDEETNKTENVNYFQALGGKLCKEKGMLKKGKVEENQAIHGLYKKVLCKFGEDAKNKNAKVFVLATLLELQEKVQAATTKAGVQQAVQEFKDEIAKVKNDANGVLVKIDAEGNVEFMHLTEEDKEKLKALIGKGDSEKYILSEELYNFIEKEVVKPIEDATK